MKIKIFYIYVILIITNIYYIEARPEDGKCVKLGADICSDLNYNLTLIPNVKMNVDTMEEAMRRVNEFQPLFNVKCFANLKYFICNMFIPMCQPINGNPTPVYPCRHVCEAARTGCEPVMKKYSFQWPDVLRCEYLSSIDDQNALCGSPPDIKPVTQRPITKAPDKPIWMNKIERYPSGIDWVRSLQQPELWNSFSKKYGIKEKQPYSTKQFCTLSDNLLYVKKNNKERCARKCDSYTTYTSSDRKFASAWISTWSVICFASTLLTVTTFLIDQRRFKYPERPIIFLSFCYNLYSIGYLIRVFQGYDEVICQQASGGKYVLYEGTSCTLVFFFLYFFGMASALWWVILSLTWFLSAALKWGHEAIEKYSSIFHAVSWTVPTIQTIVALVMRKADPDTLSGLCYVGNSNSKDLLLFVVLPLLTYLIIGTLFLSMGFISLIKIRKVLRQERNTNKLERLMLRIGVFTVLYSVPASIVVGCFIHEYNRLKSIEESVSKDFLSSVSEDSELVFLPKVELFYLRYFMSLVVGVTSGVWIWTSKTLDSWKQFYISRCKSQSNTEEKKVLYKQSKVSTDVKRRISSDIHHINTTQQQQQQQQVTSLHGSSVNMNNQIYIAPQPRFYYPVTQTPAGYMQAHNVPVSEVNPMDTNSRGFTITPLTTADENSHFENSHYQFDVNNHNYINPMPGELLSGQPSSKQYSTSNSDQNSASQHSYSSMPQNGRVEPPSSPKSVSTRSYYSSDGRKI